MLTDDLYSAISNMATSIDNMMSTHEQETSDNINSLCGSIDNLCKTVSDNKNIEGTETILGLIAGVLAGDVDKIEQGASTLAKSVNEVSSALKDIGESSRDVVSSTNDISTSMKYLSEGVESVGIQTLISAKISNLAFPSISMFILGCSDLFSSIADKVEEMKTSSKCVHLIRDSIIDITEAAGFAVIGGSAALLATPLLIPISLFVSGASLVFMMANKLFDAKHMKETGDAISSMAVGIRDLSISAVAVTLASPFFILGTAALIPMSLFVVAVAGLNSLVESLFGDKKKKDYSAIKSMAMGILYMSLAAGAAIITSPIALLAMPCVLVLGLFTLAVSTFVVKPVESLVGSKEFKNFKGGVFAMSLGILSLGLTASSSILLTPIMLLGSLSMVATGLFVKISGSVFKAAAKNTNNYIKGSLGMVIMSAGFLATSYLLVKAVSVGKDLLTFDTLGVLGVLSAAVYGGTKLMHATGKAMGSVIKGAVAVMLVAGAVYGSAYLFNKAVVECKGLIENPESTIEGLLGLVAAIGVMGTGIAAAGFALPFIVPGAAAVGLVAGTVFMTAKSIKSASDAWESSQQSGVFEVDDDGSTPFSRTVSGVVGSMIDAVKDIKDIDKLGDAIQSILPISDFVQKLAVGVSEFSKISMMKGEIADSQGNKMPFNLSGVGDGISAVCGSIINGIADAMDSFNFSDDNMVEIETGGFLGIGGDKIKIPKQIAAIKHLMPLADFVSSISSGVSEFSKLASMKGDITTYENGKHITRPFNLQDVGKGIGLVMQSLMEGITNGLNTLMEGGEMVEIETGGFLGIGSDTIKVPAKIANLQHIMPLASFISSCAELISNIGKDNKIDSGSIGDIFSGIINAFNIEGIEDKLADAGDGLDNITSPLEDFCNIEWKSLPDENGVNAFSQLITMASNIETSKSDGLKAGASALSQLAAALSGDDNIFSGNIKETADGIVKSVDAINTIDIDKANALRDVYKAMADASSKRQKDIETLVEAIKDSADAIVGAVGRNNASPQVVTVNNTSSKSATTPKYNNYNNYNNDNNNNKDNTSYAQQSPRASKVNVDLTINGIGGDSWIIKRK